MRANLARLAGRLAGLSFLLLTLALSGCADLQLDQARDDMLVRLGDERRMSPAAPSSDLFLDYALLSDQTYADSMYDRRRPRPFDIGDDTYCDRRASPDAKCADRLGLTAYARARLSRWQLVYAEMDVNKFPCPPQRLGCTGPTPGLGVQVWMRKGRICPEAVVAFRGTDGQSADDWLSNFRWFLRAFHLYDQYAQVQDYTPAFIREIMRQPCYARGRTQITAVGHSLGGGLAQQAAYRDGSIRSVQTFDPTFVTGFYDLAPEVRETNLRGLRIERVYELGEILGYPRYVLRQITPYPSCDPMIHTVRLHTIAGSPIDRHNLNSMTTALLGWSKQRHDAGFRADAPLVPTGDPRCMNPRQTWRPAPI